MTAQTQASINKRKTINKTRTFNGKLDLLILAIAFAGMLFIFLDFTGGLAYHALNGDLARPEQTQSVHTK